MTTCVATMYRVRHIDGRRIHLRVSCPRPAVVVVVPPMRPGRVVYASAVCAIHDRGWTAPMRRVPVGDVA